MSTTSNIGTAILRVYKDVGYVQKTGNNTFHKYRYASEADLIAALRPAMVDAGIVFYPSSIDDIRTSEATNAKGDTNYHFTAKYTFCLHHAESNTQTFVSSIGEGMDKNGDKAAYKAATGAAKYALRQAFMIETGDDPDHEEEKKPAKAAASVAKPAAVAKQPVQPPAPEVDEAAMIALKDKLIAEMDAMKEGDKAAYEKFVKVQEPNLQAIKLFSKTNGAVSAELTAVVVRTKERVGAA